MTNPAITLEPGGGAGSGRPAPAGPRADTTGPPGPCQVEIVVPVKDEETDLAASVRRLQA